MGDINAHLDPNRIHLPQPLPQFFETDVVGTRYYNSNTVTGDVLQVARDPANPYDVHAIAISTAAGIQVGSVSRVLAAELAPLMDAGLLVTDAVTGPPAQYTLPAVLHFANPPHMLGSQDSDDESIGYQEASDEKGVKREQYQAASGSMANYSF